MTRRDRVIAALGHRQTELVPFNVAFTRQEQQKLALWLGNPNFLDDWGGHLQFDSFAGWPERIPGKPDFYRDAFGVVWNRTGVDKDIGVIDSPLVPDIANRSYRLPSVDEGRIRREIDALIANKADRFAIYGIGFSLFERAWTLCSMEEVLVAMISDGPALYSLLEEICEYDLKIIDIISKYKEIDGVYFGDDWGQQKGLIMGSKHWRNYIKPYMARLYARVKSAGKFVLQHSCGDIFEIFTDLVDIGLDAYQTFQPEIYDIEKVKREFGSSLAFWGGVSTQRLLPFAAPEEVESQTRKLVDIMGVNGEFIAAPTHDIPGDVPPENVLAMMKVFWNQ
jgi:uroporphyrinogen decarboxylase